VPIEYEAFGDLGGICSVQDDREQVSGSKQLCDCAVHEVFFGGLRAALGWATKYVDQLVCEGDVEFTWVEVRLEGDHPRDEVDFRKTPEGNAMPEGQFRNMTERCA